MTKIAVTFGQTTIDTIKSAMVFGSWFFMTKFAVTFGWTTIDKIKSVVAFCRWYFMTKKLQ